MQGKENIDGLLAESFKFLVLEEPIEKITIKEITDRAGVIRPTFYNHFQDKYELLEWIIRKEITDPIKPLIDGGFIQESFTLIFKNIYVEKDFYMRACKLEGQNSFEEICQKCIEELFLDMFHKKAVKDTDIKWLTYERMAMYYSYTLCYMMISWIKSGYAAKPDEMTDIYHYLLNHSLQDVIEELQ